jgi:hypothetical protein
MDKHMKQEIEMKRLGMYTEVMMEGSIYILETPEEI